MMHQPPPARGGKPHAPVDHRTGRRPAGYRLLCAFTLLSEAVSTGKIDLAVAYATWGAIGILGTALGGLLLFGERLRPVGWLGMVVMAVAVALLTTA